MGCLQVAGQRLAVVVAHVDDVVGDEQPGRLLEHALRAPSAGFTQGWAFLVLEDAADRELRYDGPDLPSVKRFDPARVRAAIAPTAIPVRVAAIRARGIAAR